MFLKTNIPETTLSLTGTGVDFGDKMSDGFSVIYRTNQIQAVVRAGNRCGHVPAEPRFFSRPEHHKPRPSFLESAIEALKEVYLKPKKFFRKLETFHPHNRQKRSERREAIIAVSQVLLHYLELSTLRVGFYADPNKFRPLDLAYIAKKAGLGLTRAKRAIADLARTGYIKVSRQFMKKDDGTVKAFPSIREIAIQFFIDLGMDIQRLAMIRKWKSDKQEKAQAKAAGKKLKGIIQTIASFGGRVFSSSGKRKTTAHQAIDRDLTRQALELHRLNPTRSPSDYLKELLQQRLKE